MINNKSVTAVLCGDLNLARCFVSTGIPTLIVSPDPHDLTFYSRYCRRKKVIANPLSDPDQAIRDLVELGEGFSQKPVLFYGDDPMLLLISRNRERLAKYYRFLMPEPRQVEELVDKTRFYQLAKRLELPIPKTVLSHDVQTADEVCRYLSLPCILKPNLHAGWFKSRAILEDGSNPGKVLRVNRISEFNRQYDRMKQFTNDFVIQEYIPGTEKNVYSFHAYFDQNSEALAHYVGRKIRTYPKDSGVSTYLELVKEPEVIQAGLDILKKLNFTGAVKIDFKKNEESNRLYLLEINPRFTLWNYLGAVCGVNLPQIAYTSLVGGLCRPQTDHKTDIKWLSFGGDMRTFIRDYHPAEDLSWREWIFSYRARKIYDLFSWSDPLPFVVNLFRYSLNFLKKRVVRV